MRASLSELRERWGLWPGALALVSSLVGTALLHYEGVRLVGVLLILLAAPLAVWAWHDWPWSSAFSEKGRTPADAHASRSRNILFGVGLAVAALLTLAANLAYVADPRASFGLAGWLWLASISLLLGSGLALRGQSRTERAQDTQAVTASSATGLPVRRAPGAQGEHRAAGDEHNREPWNRAEVATLAGIVLLALILRVWNLRDIPDNIYPDEIMTGQVAAGAYLAGQPAPSLFSTLWGGIELPALWFFIVARFMEWGGSTLEMLRLPAALFGAATLLPFYGLVRNTWGRWAALAGAVILATSGSNVHYSRLALNNIAAPFFWTVCFYFLLRALRTRSPLNWALAGIAAGLSEHFYNGTRLLPFLLVGYLLFLLVVYRARAKELLSGYAVLALGYLAAFGPLLAHFFTHENLYFGRGTEMLTWRRIPTSLEDLGAMWSTLAPLVADNLLGTSTTTSQDIIYFGSLLLVPEAALLVLGFALLVWKWKHPAAFLLLFTGLAAYFVGGTLITYPNSFFPQINHWTPAFPAFYAAVAVGGGALVLGAFGRQSRRGGIVPWLAASLVALCAVWNIGYYFTAYRADAASLRSEPYRHAQEYYDVQTAQSRYVASLGAGYRVAWVGQSAWPYDPQTTAYLMGREGDTLRLANPETEVEHLEAQGKPLAFIFFPDNLRYLGQVEARFPGGEQGVVRGAAGQELFFTYEVGP